MNKEIKPNLFIIGAPKSGTTLLYEQLRTHQDIFMCIPKEPNYFCSDFSNLQYVDSYKEYINLFRNCKSNVKVIGEASAWYLYSKSAIDNIYNFNKDAKIIVMIRNPIEVVLSLHSHFLFNFYEVENSFINAWKLQKERKNGKFIPKQCKESRLLQYKDATKIGTQLEKLYTIFPDKQIKCILLEDYIEKKYLIYNEILEFLSINPGHQPSFKKINSEKTHKVLWINRILLNPPSLFRWLWKKVKNIFGPNIIRYADKIILLNTKRSKNKFEKKIHKIVANEYDSEIMKMSKILNKDLTAWTK